MSEKRFELLNDAQWELIEPLLPDPKRRKDKRGRPWASNCACLKGISVHIADRRSVAFIARHLSFCGDVQATLEAVEETFLDGNFALAKKGDPPSVQPRVAKGHEVDGTGQRWRSAARSRAGKCLFGRSHTRRTQSPLSQSPPENETKTGDHRARLRL